MRRPDPEGALRDDGTRDGPGWLRALLALLAAGLAGGLATVLALAPGRDPLLPELVDANLEGSGVSSPVTAVLLNFRAYDTLLEVVVLAVAMAVVWSLDRGSRPLGRDVSELADPALESLARLVVPIAGLTAVTLTWAGTHATGGAFQAAALLAGVGVLLTTAGLLRPLTAEQPTVRAIAAAPIYLFVAVGVGALPITGHLFGYPDGWAYPIILALEAALTVSIAVVLVQLFVDVPAVPEPDPKLEALHPTGDPLGRVLSPSDRQPGDTRPLPRARR